MSVSCRFSWLVALSLLAPALHAQLAPAAPRIKPAHYAIPPGWETRIITVKFRDGLTVRLREGELTDLGSGALRDAAGVLAELDDGVWSRSHSLPEATLDAARANAERNLGIPMPDLNLQFRLALLQGTEATQAIDALNALACVEMAEAIPRPMTLPQSTDFRGKQRYFAPATQGTGVVAASQLPVGVGPTNFSAAGGHVRVADIEYSFNAQHVDLPPIAQIGMTGSDPFNDDRHGTAVLGELVARADNAFGVSGGCHQSQANFAGAAWWDPNVQDHVLRIEDAITDCMNALGNGGLILLEQQIAGPNYTGAPAISQLGLVPVEWYWPIWNAIRVAVGNGLTVVEAGGNGNENLDAAIYSQGHGNHYPFLSTPASDSGAIIVGAGASSEGAYPDRSRLSFPANYWGSNYGSALDLQGWGEKVTTLAYGDLHNNGYVNEHCTANFGGTSGASPIVAAACAVVQSIRYATYFTYLAPLELRTLLVNTGSPQAGTQHIGPRPDALKAALAMRHVPALIPVRGFEWFDQLGPQSFVFSTAVFDDDGAGPHPPALYVGGEFTYAGGVLCNSIAKWTGSGWEALGTGGAYWAYYPQVYALAVHDLDGNGPQPAALYAGGKFDSMGGVASPGLAKWNGTSWSAVGGGVTSNGDVRALVSHDEDGTGPLQPSLIVGGDFITTGGASCVVRWRSNAWSSIGQGLNSRVYSLAIFDPDHIGPQPAQLVAGGQFWMSGGTQVRNLGQWNGSSWSEVGGGGEPVYGTVFTLEAVRWGPPDATMQVLFVGGDFNWVGSQPAKGFAERISNGAGGTQWWVPTNVPFDRPVFEIEAFEDNADMHPGMPNIYVCGLDASGWAFNTYRVNITNWTWWSNVAQQTQVHAFEVFDEDGAGASPPALFLGCGLGTTGGYLRKLYGATREPLTYCTAKLASIGCLPTITSVGFPSASMPGGFTVSASNVISNKVGLMLYGFNGRHSGAFQGGTLCVKAPYRRSPVLASGGSASPDCSGSFSLDMNAFASGALGGNPAPELNEPGRTVNCQFWGRDPGFPAPNNSMLSDALEYLIAP